MLGGIVGVWSGNSCSAADRSRPNIVFVLTDDQGYGDLGCHGNPILKTPHIDRFYQESTRFTDFHVSPTCAPTRCALLTGRHEFRSGVTHTILERERMSLKAVTLPQVLKSVGYTTGIFGKWHLGDEAPYQPDQRGFDEVFIHGGGGIGQTYPGSCGDAPGNRYFDPAILHNRVFVKARGYCTDVFFGEALKWMDHKRGSDAPFFAFITPNAPHAPLDCPEEYVRPYASKVGTNAAKFFGMIANIDENFGRLTAKLKEWGLERDTLVIFMTDNGGTAGLPVFNASMRGGKGTPFNGGTRVPSFWRWPGVFRAGADVDALTAHIDVLPTLADLTGAKLPEGVPIDGRSLVPLAEDPRAPWRERILFTHFGRWERGKIAEAKYASAGVRDPRYNLVNTAQDKEDWQLFDLKTDPAEKTNIITLLPEKALELKLAFDRWWNELQPDLVNEAAVGPRINPFKEQYWKQFGGGPDAALLKEMDPLQPWPPRNPGKASR